MTSPFEPKAYRRVGVDRRAIAAKSVRFYASWASMRGIAVMVKAGDFEVLP